MESQIAIGIIGTIRSPSARKITVILRDLPCLDQGRHMAARHKGSQLLTVVSKDKVAEVRIVSHDCGI